MVKNATLVLWIIAIGMAIIGLMSLGIISTVIYLSIRYGRPPDFLANWGGLIIGFFIGSFFNFARAALTVETKNAD